MNNILTEYGAIEWLAWYGSETVPPTDTSVFKKTCSLVLMSSKKHVLMSSCPHVLKKHVLLSNRWLAWYGSETVPPTILVI